MNIYMKKLITLLAVIAVTSVLTFAQTSLKVTNTGVGVGIQNPTEKLHVDGLVQSKGATYRDTNYSGTALYERTDRSAILMGAGWHAGFTFDENYNFEITTNTRAKVLNRLLSGSGGTLIMRGVGATGNFGFGISNPTERITVAGNIFATGMITPSDRRLKDNVTSFTDGLSVINKLKTIRYTYNGKAGLETDDVHIGVYAQELQEVAPYLVEEFVHQEEDDFGKVVVEETYLKIRDGEIKYLLVNAIQEQQALIEKQQKMIEALQGQVEVFATFIENTTGEKMVTR